jgi:alginate O-acetyltransferase complex protein AlgI
MNFTSFEFAIFFGLVVLVRHFLRNLALEKVFLLLASLGFYLTWSIPCVFLIVFTSMGDYFIGRKLGDSSNPATRRRLLFTSLALNLGFLGFFKYSNFFLENFFAVLNGVGVHAQGFRLNIILPPAISFFTFASLSYTLDLYYERIPPCKSLRDYALFITFFPKLLSGPIVRASEFLPQLKDRLRASWEDVEIGLGYILIGAVKKLVIADQMAGHVSVIFSAPEQYDGMTLFAGAVGYTVQLYCDFSGYSDIATGCARIMGFRFPENFQMPFSAASITEFWRRWHITLSRWFRDYLFLPLEMATRSNPNPTLRVVINMILMMVLCGLWHGASWNFIVWGAIHGGALAAHKVWTVWKPLEQLKKQKTIRLIWTMIAHLLTMSVVVISMIFFRAPTLTEAGIYLNRLFSWSHTGTRLSSPYILMGILGVLLVHLIVRKDRNVAPEFPQRRPLVRILAYASLLLLLVLLGATDSSPFIYFRF